MKTVKVVREVLGCSSDTAEVELVLRKNGLIVMRVKDKEKDLEYDIFI